MWSAACQTAFTDLKNALIKAPVLAVFDPNREHEVWVDASDFAIGAALV